jgi:Eukaryotic initiation factor 4E
MLVRIIILSFNEFEMTDKGSGDQLCGVGLSVRFNSHLISVWHRDASQQKSIDAILATVLEELPAELKPKPDNYFYKKHSDHVGFKAPAITTVAPAPAIEVPKV